MYTLENMNITQRIPRVLALYILEFVALVDLIPYIVLPPDYIRERVDRYNIGAYTSPLSPRSLDALAGHLLLKHPPPYSQIDPIIDQLPDIHRVLYFMGADYYNYLSRIRLVEYELAQKRYD